VLTKHSSGYIILLGSSRNRKHLIGGLKIKEDAGKAITSVERSY